MPSAFPYGGHATYAPPMPVRFEPPPAPEKVNIDILLEATYQKVDLVGYVLHICTCCSGCAACVLLLYTTGRPAIFTLTLFLLHTATSFVPSPRSWRS